MDFSHRKQPWGSWCVILLSMCSRSRCSRSRSGRARCTTISHCLSTTWLEPALERHQKIDVLGRVKFSPSTTIAKNEADADAGYCDRRDNREATGRING